jgi:TPR repeat protein
VPTARLFYERAANAGDAQAALHLGQTYDPAFLAQIKARGVRPDASAARWYLQADKMGAPEAAMLLRALAKDLGLSAPAQREHVKR